MLDLLPVERPHACIAGNPAANRPQYGSHFCAVYALMLAIKHQPIETGSADGVEALWIGCANKRGRSYAHASVRWSDWNPICVPMEPADSVAIRLNI